MSSFEILGASPVSADPSATIPVAVRRAGAVGILDLTRGIPAPQPLSWLSAGRGWGVRVGDPGAAAALLSAPGSGLPDDLHGGTLLLGCRTGVDAGAFAAVAADWRRRGGRIVAEVTSLDEARGLAAAGPDGLLATGAEVGGWTGEQNTFVLLQQLLAARLGLPICAHGGIGLHTAAAARALGAAGVLLDAQLLLARESPLSADQRQRLSRLDGSETISCPVGGGHQFRLLPPAGLGPAGSGAGTVLPGPNGLPGLTDLPGHAGTGPGEALAVGQDIAFAASLAALHPTVGRQIAAFRSAVSDHVRLAGAAPALAPDGPLARRHHTRLPIVQGPMTRVSDRPEFAHAVAEAGGLPFLALAVLRGAEVDRLLDRTADLLGDQSWGVGILGFVSDDLRAEQLAAIRRHRPPYALIAGGQPEQVQELQAAGITSYVHVPSPGLLRLFLAAGIRRFVFEGSECGGHVGPRSSFTLWESMITELVAELGPEELADCQLLFAGGIHDAGSAAAVAAAAAPLTAAGAAIGVLMGSAYLVTDEIVDTGAVTEEFRSQALRCSATALLHSGRGYATRCADTPIVAAFQAEQQRLQTSGAAPAEILDALEQFNLGRLRIASKALGHGPSGPVPVPLDVQRAEGLFMMGQVAALRDRIVPVAELHRDVSDGSTRWLRRLAEEAGFTINGDVINSDKINSGKINTDKINTAKINGATINGEKIGVAKINTGVIETGRRPERDVAVVGMSCLLPGAADLDQFWANVLAGTDAITEVPADRWDPARYFDPDPAAADRTYSRWGGFLPDIVFDPVAYGMPPNSLPQVEGMQLLALHAVREAIRDAGYADGGLPLDTTSVIFGAGGGVSELGQQYAVRAALPGLLGGVPAELERRLPQWTEDTFPGILVNVTAGRVANRFDFGGLNLTVDAACASSLAALQIGARELRSGSSDAVVVGGVDTMQNSFGYLAFAKTHALSSRGRCRPFDASADGIAISEGVSVVVLKRLADAEADGDRIYAVLRGIGGSSDGRARGLTAPRPEGQAKALQRAYADAGCSPASVGLIEAHGTGTVAGDRAEVQTLRTVFTAAGADRQRCAIGSVKSMIGHTKCAAGLTGVIKVAKALHHRTLPPTIGVETPNPEADFDSSPFFVNTTARPWYADGGPRRAGVSAFGFGGTNFHAVLEEYDPAAPPAPVTRRPQELFVWTGPRERIGIELDTLLSRLEEGRPVDLGELAAATRTAVARGQTSPRAAGDAVAVGRLAVVARDLRELPALLRLARRCLDRDEADAPQLSWRARPGRPAIAFLYPGQGSQRTGMLQEVAVHSPEVADALCRASAVLADDLPARLVDLMQPRPAFTERQRAADEAALRATEVAQPALGAAAVGLTRLLDRYGIRPELTGGHSYGEYPALWAAGVLSEDELYRLSYARGRCIAAHARDGSMLAVTGSAAEIESVLSAAADRPAQVWASNRNSPRQTVLSGTAPALQAAARILTEAGLECRPLNVAAAFHSPLVEPAAAAFAEVLAGLGFSRPRIPVYANSTADRYRGDDVRDLLTAHLTRPVRFADQLETMYAALAGSGSPTFVEVGPGSVLTGLARQTLTDRPLLALTVDGGLGGLLTALGRLWVAGGPVLLDRLDADRPTLRTVDEVLAAATPPAGSWLVNGAGARPLVPAPEPADPSPVDVRPEDVRPLDVRPLDVRPVDVRPVEVGPEKVEPVEAQPEEAEPVNPGPVRSGPGTAAVLADFQRVMDQFLQTQREVMLGFLADGRPPATRRKFRGFSDPSADGAGVPAQGVPAPMPVATPPVTTPPVSTPPVAATPAETASSAEPDRTAATAGEVIGRLRRLLAERTGYPEELITDDLDLEADLGIDSIKRTEVIGLLLRQQSGRPGVSAGSLRGTRTLSQLAAALAGPADGAGRGTDHSEPDHAELDHAELDHAEVDHVDVDHAEVDHADVDHAEGDHVQVDHARGDQVNAHQARGDQVETDHAERVPRCVPVRRQLPVPAADGTAGPTITSVVIIDAGGSDNRGGETADALRSGFLAHGVGAAVVRTADRDGKAGTTEESVADTVRTAQSGHDSSAGTIGVVILYQPADHDRGGVSEADAVSSAVQRLRSTVQSVLHARPDRPERTGLLLVTPSGSPESAALSGFMTTLAAERSGTVVRAVRTAPDTPPAELADRLIAEFADPSPVTEVDFSGTPAAGGAVDAESARWTTVFVPRPLPRRGDTGHRWHSGDGSVALLTGGGRGITALLAAGLARSGIDTLVLAGRTAAPDHHAASSASSASPEVRRADSPTALRAALFAEATRAGRQPRAADIEAAAVRIERQRELAATLSGLQQLGARVDYRQLDVTDATAVQALVDDVTARYGHPRIVVHGAGLVADHLIEDLSRTDTERVLRTKLHGAHHLVAALQPARLEHLVLLTSVAGWFGNPGQAAYAAANRALDQLAERLAASWPCRVTAMSWGPWDAAGMATPAIRDQFRRRGIAPIPPDAAVDAFLAELDADAGAPAHLLIGSGPWVSDPPPAPAQLGQPQRAAELVGLGGA